MPARLERSLGAGPGLTAGIRLDFRRIAAAIRRMGREDLSGAARTALDLSLDEMVRDVRVAKMSGRPAPVSSRGPIPRGGQYLGVRTGAGRASMRKNIRQEGPDRIIGEFGSDAAAPGVKAAPADYIPVHEQGFRGTVHVPAHMRRTPGGRRVPVRPHERFMDLPARRFIRAALLEGRPKLQRNTLVVLEALFGRLGAPS